MGPVDLPCAVRHQGGGVGIALRSRLAVGIYPNGVMLTGREVNFEEWLVEWDDGSRTWEPSNQLRELQ